MADDDNIENDEKIFALFEEVKSILKLGKQLNNELRVRIWIEILDSFHTISGNDTKKGIYAKSIAARMLASNEEKVKKTEPQFFQEIVKGLNYFEDLEFVRALNRAELYSITSEGINECIKDFPTLRGLLNPEEVTESSIFDFIVEQDIAQTRAFENRFYEMQDSMNIMKGMLTELLSNTEDPELKAALIDVLSEIRIVGFGIKLINLIKHPDFGPTVRKTLPPLTVVQEGALMRI